jgi:hypothetical protein
MRIIAPMMRAAGLDIRPMSRPDGEVFELVITNPQYPTWGRVIIDREGFTEWRYWGDLADDDAAARLATVIKAIMAPRPGDNAARGTRPAYRPAPEADRPRP